MVFNSLSALMKTPLPDPIQDLLWRQELTTEQRATLAAWLVKHPEARDAVAEEQILTGAIKRLPDAPVASNFTARVLAELERLERRDQATVSPTVTVWRRFSTWLPRAAAAGLVIGLSVLAWHQHRATVHAELATSLAARVAELGPDVVENFDSVQRFAGTKPDLVLLRALE